MILTAIVFISACMILLMFIRYMRNSPLALKNSRKQVAVLKPRNYDQWHMPKHYDEQWTHDPRKYPYHIDTVDSDTK